MREILEPDNALAVIRYRGEIQYWLSDRENWILDWNRRREELVTAGRAMPELRAMAEQRWSIAILDRDTVELFLNASGVHRIDPAFLRKSPLERFDSAQAWWDVEFLFPIAFVDFDNRRFAGFHQDGPRLKRYVPDDWKGEFADFANTYPEELYPSAAKFWMVDGRDLLRELIARGRNG